jgi:hypothetical protein
MRCAECDREADDHPQGWRAMLAEEWETDGSLYVVTYCPECAAREFGERKGVNAGQRVLPSAHFRKTVDAGQPGESTSRPLLTSWRLSARGGRG